MQNLYIKKYHKSCLDDTKPDAVFCEAFKVTPKKIANDSWPQYEIETLGSAV